MTPHVTSTSTAVSGLGLEDGHKQLLYHVFLPSTYTTSTKNPNDINPTFLPLINKLLSKSLPKDSRTLQSFQLWEAHQNLDPGPTSTTISSLDVGQTLPICGIILLFCILLYFAYNIENTL
jgi:hypothetical protein